MPLEKSLLGHQVASSSSTSTPECSKEQQSQGEYESEVKEAYIFVEKQGITSSYIFGAEEASIKPKLPILSGRRARMVTGLLKAAPPPKKNRD